jgi:hypothetical protein
VPAGFLGKAARHRTGAPPRGVAQPSRALRECWVFEANNSVLRVSPSYRGSCIGPLSQIRTGSASHSVHDSGEGRHMPATYPLYLKQRFSTSPLLSPEEAWWPATASLFSGACWIFLHSWISWLPCAFSSLIWHLEPGQCIHIRTQRTNVQRKHLDQAGKAPAPAANFHFTVRNPPRPQG